MKKTVKHVAIILLALLVVAASIGAFFTSTDVKSDSYTIGQIEVEIVGDDNLYEALRLTPNYEYTFTRSVKNIGINDAYVFVAVTIPYEKVYTHDASGNQVEAGINELMDVQLFRYGTNGVAGVSSEWAPVTAGQFGDYDIAALDGLLKNTSGEYGAKRVNRTVTYVYAYVGDNGNTLERLAPDETTGAIFDIMKFADVNNTTEEYNLEGASGQIKTQVFAIQADNVLETDPMTGDNTDGSEAINAVWQVLNTATNDKSLSATDADELALRTVKLTIFDQEELIVSGAVVRISGTDANGNPVVFEGTTSDMGVVSFEASKAQLPDGTYNLFIEVPRPDGTFHAPLNADSIGQIVIEGNVDRIIEVVVPPLVGFFVMDENRRPEEIISITVYDGKETVLTTPGINPSNENPVVAVLNSTTFRIVSVTTASGTYYLSPPTADDNAFAIGSMQNCTFTNGDFTSVGSEACLISIIVLVDTPTPGPQQ